MRPSKNSSMGKWKEVKPKQQYNRRRKYQSDFNPDREFICRAMQDYLNNGGRIDHTDCSCIVIEKRPGDTTMVDDFLTSGTNGDKRLSRSYEQIILRRLYEN